MDCYPVVSYTTEEIEERSPIYKDLSTYLQQAKAQFITGELAVDQDWDTYVNTVEQMNAGRLLEIEQAVYEEVEYFMEELYQVIQENDGILEKKEAGDTR